jgi:hypothetical protein
LEQGNYYALAYDVVNAKNTRVFKAGLVVLYADEHTDVDIDESMDRDDEDESMDRDDEDAVMIVRTKSQQDGGNAVDPGRSYALVLSKPRYLRIAAVSSTGDCCCFPLTSVAAVDTALLHTMTTHSLNEAKLRGLAHYVELDADENELRGTTDRESVAFAAVAAAWHAPNGFVIEPSDTSTRPKAPSLISTIILMQYYLEQIRECLLHRLMPMVAKSRQTYYSNVFGYSIPAIFCMKVDESMLKHLRQYAAAFQKMVQMITRDKTKQKKLSIDQKKLTVNIAALDSLWKGLAVQTTGDIGVPPPVMDLNESANMEESDT